MTNSMGFTTLCPSRTVVTSFTPLRRASDAASSTGPNNDKLLQDAYDQGDWVLCLAQGGNTVSCALSNGEVQVYDSQRLTMNASYGTPKHGQNVISQINYGPDGTTLLSAGQDGTLVVYDIRQAQPVLKTKAASNCASLESVSIGFNGTLAAAGSGKGKIHFFDLRQGGNLLGTYGDSHTDAVSQVHFSSASSSTLLTGSEDGLVCCFDTSQSTEESALKSCLNIGTPIRRVGFCGDATTPEGVPTTVFCLTGSETACLWDLGTGGCLQSFGGFELRKHLTQTLAAVALTTSNQPRYQAPSFAVDYLIDAHWDAHNRSLDMAVGSVSGEAAIMRLSSQNPGVWQPSHILRGGHHGVIRAWCPLASVSHISVSAGEDARLVEWNHQSPSMNSANDVHRRPSLEKMTYGTSNGLIHAAPTTTPSGVRSAGGPLRRQMKRHKTSTSPY